MTDIKKEKKCQSESKMAVRFDTTRTEVRKAYLHLEEKATSTLCKATEAFSLERKKRFDCS